MEKIFCDFCNCEITIGTGSKNLKNLVWYVDGKDAVVTIRLNKMLSDICPDCYYLEVRKGIEEALIDFSRLEGNLMDVYNIRFKDKKETEG